MDPLAVLSLVGNVVQFVELSAKLLAEARAAYNSRVGTTAAVEDLREQMENLQALAARASQLPTDASGTPDEMALAKSSATAKRLAQDVMELSAKLKTKSPKSKLEAARVAWKTRIKKSELEGLEKRLTMCRGEIIERWIMMTRSVIRCLFMPCSNYEDSDKQSSTLHLLKEDLKSLSRSNQGVVHAVDDTKRDLDEFVKSIQQQLQHETAALEAIKGIIGKMLTATVETRVLDAIMAKLRFQDIHMRELSIADANQHTYRWLLYDPNNEKQESLLDVIETGSSSVPSTDISLKTRKGYQMRRFESLLLDEEKQRVRTRESFLCWLRSEHGLFYISGKPGSGKSTLMKLLCSEEKTNQELEAWAGGKILVFTRFFFWAAGSENQKSLEGLYRAILWEALRACPDIGKELFPENWHPHKSRVAGRLDDDNFTATELRQAFERLVTSKEILQRHKVCIFIDGLDEYSVNDPNCDHWNIAQSLMTWSQKPDVKICVSCRPHNEFEHHFGQRPLRRLRLHELTRRDMLNLIRDKLFDDDRFDTIKDQEDLAEFGKDLVEKAEGVFLWLTLAIKDLLDGLGSSYSPSQLRAQLDTIPKAVESIYEKLINSIPRSDQKLASRTILTLLATYEWREENARTDVLFSFLDDLGDKSLDDVELYIANLEFRLTEEEMTERQEAIITRINKRCKGLLQFGPVLHGSRIIEPIHRTFLDYIRQPETFASLQVYAMNFDPHLALILCHILSFSAATGDLSDMSSTVAEIQHVLDSRLFLRLVTIAGNAFERPILSVRAHTMTYHWAEPRKRSYILRRLVCNERLHMNSFTNFLSAKNGISCEKWDLILSKTRFGSPKATKKLLLSASQPGNLEFITFFLDRHGEANAVLPQGTICISAPSWRTENDAENEPEYGTHWTSWTASLLMKVSSISSAKPERSLVGMVTAYLSHNADTSVVLAGYLIENTDLETHERNGSLPVDPRYSGPFYVDLCELLQLWKAAGIEALQPFITQLRNQGIGANLWGYNMRRLPRFWSAEDKSNIRRLDTSELASKSLMVLTAIPLQRLGDIVVEDLEHVFLTWMRDGRANFVAVL
jgi:hypothetical protein